MSLEKFSAKHFFAVVLAISLAATAANAAGFSLRGFAFRALPNFAARESAAEPNSAPGPANAPSVFAPDKGKFRITISGQQVGSEDFEISSSGDTWLERSTMPAH